MKVGDKIRSCGGRFMMLRSGLDAYKRFPFMDTKRMYCMDDGLSVNEFEYKYDNPGERWGPAYVFSEESWGVVR